jgi:hypothetical protein
MLTVSLLAWGSMIEVKCSYPFRRFWVEARYYLLEDVCVGLIYMNCMFGTTIVDRVLNLLVLGRSHVLSYVDRSQRPQQTMKYIRSMPLMHLASLHTGLLAMLEASSTSRRRS